MNGWKAGPGQAPIGMLVRRRDGHGITIQIAKSGVEKIVIALNVRRIEVVV